MALIAPEIGIDLGTSNTMVYVRGRGIVVSEPTIVVIDSDNKHNVRAVGDEAEILLGRTGDKLVAVRPLKAGSIVNFDMAEILLRYFIRKAIGVSHVIKPKVLVSVPCTLPMVARKAVTEAATLAGAKTVYLIEKPFAAATPMRTPVKEPGPAATATALTSATVFPHWRSRFSAMTIRVWLWVRPVFW
mgnify:CR=1 FL=1